MAENNYDLEYTGSMVDRILDTGYDLQNQGYIFRGLASHYTGTPTERTWLIAPTGSTGFGLSSPVPPGSIGICMYNGSSWYAEVLNTLTLDAEPTAGSGNGITSGAVKTLAESITNAIGLLAQSVSDRFTSLTLEDTTGSLQEELLSITLKYVFEGETESLTSISILAATAEKAGLMSAADKQKLDAFVTNIRSMRIQDTTVQADQGTEITNTLKWTIGGVTEAITAFTLYAATTSKAGLMSAADKTALDTLPSLINAGYLYAGIATPATVPSSTSAKIFYIATEGGTYTNFDNLNVTQGINILYKSGDAWSAAQVVWIDDKPTAGSDSLVKSGGAERDNHLLAQKVNNLELIEPMEIVDGRVMLHDGVHQNPVFQFWKFAIDPNKVYYFSGRYNNTTNIRMVYVYSESNVYIDSYGLPDTEDGVIYSDESFISPANAAFAYVNVYKDYQPAFCFAKYSEIANIDLVNKLSLKSYGLYPIAFYNQYFYDNRGLVANKSLVTIKYKVDGNKKYRFSGKTNAGTNISIVTYADINDEFLSYSGKSGSLTEDVIFNNEEILTPYNAVYAYFAIQKSNYDYYKFEAVNLSEEADYSNDNVLYANKTVLVPEVTDNKLDIGTEKRTNTNYQIWKYSISPDKIYCISNMFNNANISFAYWYDANNNVISSIGEAGVLNKVISLRDYILIPPVNAAYINVNYRKGVDGVEVCEYNSDDRTDELQSKLYRYGHCKLGAGVFYINNLIMPANSRLEGCCDSSIIMLGGTSDGYAVRVSKYNQIANIRFMGAVQDLAITEPADINTISIGNRHGILLLGSGNGSMNPGNQVTDCSFRNFSGGAITLDNTYYHARNGMLVSDCHVMNCGAGINIAYYAEFNRFTNVIVQECSYGLINNGGNNNFVNCDFSTNGIGVYFNGASGKAVRYNGTSGTAGNTAHGLMSGCTINHSGFNGNDNPGYAIVYIDSIGGYLFTGIQLHYGKIYMRGSEAIQICNARFGFNTVIEASCSHLIVMSNVTVINDSGTRKRLRILAYTNDNMDTIVTNYEEDGNPKLFRLINSFLPNGDPASVSVLTD